MAERSMKILWMVLLVVAAYQDFRERQVSVMWMVCGAAAGMIGCCLMAGERYQDMLETGIDAERVSLLMNIVKIQIVRIGKAAGIGIALLILAKLTRGAMGGGDGLFFLMSAFYWDTLAISSAWGMALLMKRQWNRAGTPSVRWKETIPFLTCCLVPGILQVWNVLMQ